MWCRIHVVPRDRRRVVPAGRRIAGRIRRNSIVHVIGKEPDVNTSFFTRFEGEAHNLFRVAVGLLFW